MMKSLDAFFAWAENQYNLERSQSSVPRRTYRSSLFSVQRIAVLARLFDNPQCAYKIIHIAGSKGKGSTAHLLAHIIAAHNNTPVGCYLSPHIFDYRERFLLLPHSSLAHAQWLAIATQLRTILRYHCGDVSAPKAHPILGRVPPTTFEILTLFAFLIFREAECQWVVLECGLGGKYDSTNVVSPAATVITPIEREHVRYLGWRLASIAAQKAGIIKANTPLFLFPQRARVAVRVIERRARSLRATVHNIPKDLISKPSNAIAHLDKTTLNAIHNATHSLPFVQKMNATAAYYISAHCVDGFSPQLFCRVLDTVPQLPGRYQQIATEPIPIYCDGAHTFFSLSCTIQVFVATYGRSGMCVFGCSADKSEYRLLRTIRGAFARYIFTAGEGITRDMVPATRLARYARVLRFPRRSYCTLHTATDIVAEINTHRLPTLICGSFYLLASIMRALGTATNVPQYRADATTL